MSRNSNSGESKYLMYRNIVDTAHEVSKKECLKCSACTLAEHFVDQIPCVHNFETQKMAKVMACLCPFWLTIARGLFALLDNHLIL